MSYWHTSYWYTSYLYMCYWHWDLTRWVSRATGWNVCKPTFSLHSSPSRWSSHIHQNLRLSCKILSIPHSSKLPFLGISCKIPQIPIALKFCWDISSLSGCCQLTPVPKQKFTAPNGHQYIYLGNELPTEWAIYGQWTTRCWGHLSLRKLWA